MINVLMMMIVVYTKPYLPLPKQISFLREHSPRHPPPSRRPTPTPLIRIAPTPFLTIGHRLFTNTEFLKFRRMYQSLNPSVSFPLYHLCCPVFNFLGHNLQIQLYDR